MTTSSPTTAAAPAATHKRGPGQNRRASNAPVARLVRGLIGVLVFAGIVELISRAGIVNEKFLPPLSSVLLTAAGLFGDPVFLGDLLSTVLSFAIGLAIATVIAVPLGILLGLSQFSYRASRAVIELIRPIPPVALIPLVLLVFGQGLEMKLVIVVFAAIWPILFNTIYGVHDVDPKAKEMARSFGKGRFEVIRRVVIPSAAPFIVTGIRLSSSIALIVVVTVELIAGGATGLGAFIARNQATGDHVNEVFAGTILAGLLGLVINLAVGLVERRWLSWQSTVKEA